MRISFQQTGPHPMARIFSADLRFFLSQPSCLAASSPPPILLPTCAIAYSLYILLPSPNSHRPSSFLPSSHLLCPAQTKSAFIPYVEAPQEILMLLSFQRDRVGDPFCLLFLTLFQPYVFQVGFLNVMS